MATGRDSNAEGGGKAPDGETGGKRGNGAGAVWPLFAKPAPIKRAARGFDPDGESGATRVGLRPARRRAKGRSYVLDVLIPSLFQRRRRAEGPKTLPELPEGRSSVTWIGHASFFIRTPWGSMLIDPIWARWLKGIKRLKHAGVHHSHLPVADLVLVTHAHFDHLDKKSLRAVAAGQPIVVPFAVGGLVRRLGFGSVHELDYWESYERGTVRVTLTPCHHWGARVLHDRHRGFGGFVIETPSLTVYHCGDSAWFDGFEEIGRRFKIDVALMPIGAYEPPSGRDVHMTPEEALRAFKVLGAKHFIPMHYGSFPLSMEPMDEPLHRLQTRARLENLDVCVLEEGDSALF